MSYKKVNEKSHGSYRRFLISLMVLLTLSDNKHQNIFTVSVMSLRVCHSVYGEACVTWGVCV